MTMRIGLITGEYPPDQGGVGDFTRELGRALAILDHEIHVITTQSQITNHESQIAGLHVHCVVNDWGWRCWRDIIQLDDALGFDVLNIQYQAAAYRMHPAINLFPWRLKQRGKPPVVATFHDLKVPYLFPKAGPLRQWVVHALARQSDGVIVTNRQDEVQLSNLRDRIPNLVRIPIGSNIAPQLPPGYDRDTWRAQWGIEPDDFLLGYFGFLNESKGGEELVQTLALLVEQGVPAHLLMIGGRVGSSDPTNLAYAERVDRLVVECGLAERVHHTGFVPSEEVSASLAAVDVCVLPYRDGVAFWRGSLHACLAHGRAIVTTHPKMPLPEIQDGENMLLARPRDPKNLAEAVARLATDPALRTRLETGAAALAAEFTWEQIARRTAALFEEIASAA
jgi:glycosyltransferase involved in cell wall biosynthesis